ncbi:MAG TPA: cell wall-binding repeat-containing protein [Egibacteraceae bacterium]|nr:cell wall-binding repeat-containing protein [Egibacteraceae bacterium]
MRPPGRLRSLLSVAAVLLLSGAPRALPAGGSPPALASAAVQVRGAGPSIDIAPPAVRSSACDALGCPGDLAAVGAVNDASVHGLSGPTRIHTAVEASRAAFDAADTVFLARADAFADALVGAVLAAAEGGPILLTEPEELPTAVADELERLNTDRVVLLGGPRALSRGLERALGTHFEVRRIAGADRFATAAAVADELDSASIVFVASGDDFPDALSAAPYAAFAGSPILLAGGELSSDTAAALTRLDPDEVVVLGGEAAVSEHVAEELAAYAPHVRRLAGRTRFETSALVYDEAMAQGMDPAQLWLATGDDFPDALAAGPAVAARGATMLLVSGGDLWRQPAIVERIRARAEQLASVYLLGGEAAINSDAVLQLQEITAPGLHLPRGGRTIFPRHRLVAFYGNAQTPAMGVLGEGSPDEAGVRLLSQAAPYDSSERPLLPVFELIVTVAQRAPGADGMYRSTTEPGPIREYLEAARRIDALVLLDIQPGRSDFLTEVRRYEDLLKEPDVGIALDPEWRMGANQVPGKVIGSVDAAEVNQVSQYVAELVQRHDLPEKLFVVHQFTHGMVTNRDQIVPREGLAITFHIDGFGSRGAKLSKYDALSVEPPFHNGFKLFYDEDVDLFAPSDVLGFSPPVDLVSYQ